MKFVQYTCTLLTDVVMVSKAATEGFHASLSYIPGNKFLGIVAKDLYDMNNSQQTLDLFHNGKVQFGDAHPTQKGERLLIVPLTWEHLKYEPKSEYIQSIYIQKEVKLEDEEKKTKAPKPKTNGFKDKHYFLPSTYQVGTLEQTFSLKSAYDPNLRRSEDSKMFGYYALSRGGVFGFTIGYKDEKYIRKVEDTLLGRQGIGRSKTAEYGQVEIERKDFNAVASDKTLSVGKCCLYAESNWCFYDENGMNTTQFTAEDLGFPKDKASIDWASSQVRHRAYRTWNAHRKNRDADRVVIKKGSVIVVDLEEAVDSSIFDKGVGAHHSEGLGRVLANPSFQLLASKGQSDTRAVGNSGKKLHLTAIGKKVNYLNITSSKISDDKIVAAATRNATQVSEILALEGDVDAFWTTNAAKFKGVTNSQWGQLRRHAVTSENDKVLHQRLFNKDTGLFHTGQAQDVWQRNGRKEILEQYFKDHTKNQRTFLKKLARKVSLHNQIKN